MNRDTHYCSRPPPLVVPSHRTATLRPLNLCQWADRRWRSTCCWWNYKFRRRRKGSDRIPLPQLLGITHWTSAPKRIFLALIPWAPRNPIHLYLCRRPLPSPGKSRVCNQHRWCLRRRGRFHLPSLRRQTTCDWLTCFPCNPSNPGVLRRQSLIDQLILAIPKASLRKSHP